MVWLFQFDSITNIIQVLSVFKSSALKFIRLAPNSVFDCENHSGIKLITRLRVGLIHLREQKFKHGFQDNLNSICSCGFDFESTSHYVLKCPAYNNKRHTLLSTIKKYWS